MTVVVRSLTLCAVLFAGCPDVGWCDTREDVNRLEDKRNAAVISGDWATVDALLADEFFYNQGTGNSVTKAEYFGYMKPGDVKVKRIVREDTDVRLYGDVAVVTGRTRTYVTVKGEDRDVHARYTHVWTKKKGDNWKLAASQATFIPDNK